MDISKGTFESEGDQSWFRTVFQKIQTGIVIIDTGSHRILEVNPIAAHLIGLPREKIVGEICHRFVCPAEIGKCPITDLGQDVDNSERVLINSAGDKVPILKTVARVDAGEKQYLIESFVDISDRKRADDRKARLISYMDESVLRIQKPLELVKSDLDALSLHIKNGDMDTEDILMRLNIDSNHLGKMMHTLRELLQAAVEDREEEDLPLAFREFLSGR